jgi:hypothetical protein
VTGRAGQKILRRTKDFVLDIVRRIMVFTGFVFIGSIQIVGCFTGFFQICIHTLMVETHKHER